MLLHVYFFKLVASYKVLFVSVRTLWNLLI